MSKIELINEDCMNVMVNYPDKYFDLSIVDPPYGIGEDGRKTQSRDYKRRDPRNGAMIDVKVKKYKSAGWDNNYPDQDYFDLLFSKSRKVIIWGENYIQFKQKETSKGRIIWNKFTGDNDFSDCEIAWTNTIKSVRMFDFMWAGFRQGKSITEGNINQGNKSLCEERIHPTQKPVALYKWLLHNYAKPVCNNKHTEEYKSLCTDCNKPFRILDTHLGSGSSAIAAHSMGFDFVGCELDKDYYDAACKRFKEQTMQQKLFI